MELGDLGFLGGPPVHTKTFENKNLRKLKTNIANILFLFDFCLFSSLFFARCAIQTHDNEPRTHERTNTKGFKNKTNCNTTMGLRGANSILYSITGLSIKALKEIACSRASDDERLVRIDVDCSWVAHKLAAKSGHCSEAGEMTAEVLHLLSKAGFVVTPICDPLHRHHSKRASVERIAKKEKARLTALFSRYELIALSQKMGLPTLTAQEKAETEKEIESLNKIVKTSEKKASSNGGLSSSFVSDLELALDGIDAHMINEHQCFVEKVQVAYSQADALIAQRSVEGKSHLILANDSDFLTLVGGKCVTIRDFSVRRGRGNRKTDATIADFAVACCTAETYATILAALSLSEEQKIKKKNLPKFPLFDGYGHRFRATVAVIMGSDVLVGGVKDIGAAKIALKIENYKKDHIGRSIEDVDEELLRKHIVSWVCQTKKIKEEIFEAFVDAFLYEPANTTESVEAGKALVYVHEVPLASLPKYLEGFCLPGGLTELVEGPETCL